ncbi:hypothetical protein O3G_MSEX012458 [Manduca sexta]|uniref:Uncharacterized protein n=1 Tax=Manduca sexta TaxID=7130 RepID=A0A921ZNA7_MANSE|nr:hypothetical protein O3G_MSEX012458 [Manduca sexta]
MSGTNSRFRSDTDQKNPNTTLPDGIRTQDLRAAVTRMQYNYATETGKILPLLFTSRCRIITGLLADYSTYITSVGHQPNDTDTRSSTSLFRQNFSFAYFVSDYIKSV